MILAKPLLCALSPLRKLSSHDKSHNEEYPDKEEDEKRRAVSGVLKRRGKRSGDDDGDEAVLFLPLEETLRDLMSSARLRELVGIDGQGIIPGNGDRFFVLEINSIRDIKEERSVTGRRGGLDRSVLVWVRAVRSETPGERGNAGGFFQGDSDCARRSPKDIRAIANSSKREKR
ncbi:hypothetical protein HOY82DRAFT_536414 [Tuber indicum]|nr:hypothetical protein HOY82DRAFT_536414 [Tuber indicum]